MHYKYFIPTIHIGPVSGSKFINNLAKEKIKEIIIGKNAELEVSRSIYKKGTLIFEKKKILRLTNNSWVNAEGFHFSWESKCKSNEYCYIETEVNLLSGIGLNTSFLPGLYDWYIHNKKKNYVGCYSYKYGNPRVIMQMEEFGFWIDGYPAININEKQDVTSSLIIVNPYNLNGKYNLEISELNIKKSILVKSRSVERINLHDIINKKIWTGQVYITGKQRGIVYFMNHSIKNNLDIYTLEHSDPYRAELTYKPRFMYFRERAHNKLKNNYPKINKFLSKKLKLI